MEVGGRVARVSDRTWRHVILSRGGAATGRLMYRAGDVLCSIERTLELRPVEYTVYPKDGNEGLSFSQSHKRPLLASSIMS